MNLVPEDIRLVVGLGPHESQFAIRYRAIAMVDETLLSQDAIMAARHRYQDDKAKTGQSFVEFFHHTILGAG